jgi:hypothetical protein
VKERTVNIRVQRWCAWSAVPAIGLLFVGLLIAGFLPPVAPSNSAEALKEIFVQHQRRIQVGMLVGLLGTGFLGPFVAVITVALKRIEGPRSPLAYAQLMLGVMLPVVLVLPLTWLEGAAFRVDRDAASIQVFSDQAWLLIVGAFYAFVVQMACTGLAILRDESAGPLFPRWLAYLNFWCAIGSLPAAGVYFFQDGPLAWNGVLSFWLPAACFGGWALVMMVMVLRAVDQPEPPPGEDLERLAERVAQLLREKAHSGVDARPLHAGDDVPLQHQEHNQ